MKLFLVRRDGTVNATVEYDPIKKTFTVIKGSKISASVALNTKFRSAKSIEKAREGIVLDQILQKNVVFKSASTAANFITGASTNGLIALKNSKGKTLRELLGEKNDE